MVTNLLKTIRTFFQTVVIIESYLENILGANDTGNDDKILKEQSGVAAAEMEDPYAYLQRPNFSSENFKIEIMNLPKYYGAGVK